jgi:hypothetical protein
MNIPERQIEALTAFGYTVSEARFLYIVAMHSGYFTARQFLAFVNAKRGYRTHSLAQKLITQGHATMREYRRNGCIYHLYSRKLYAQLGHENLRNRRRHRLAAIRTRLLALDFILANQGYQYLETEAEKIAYFYDQLHIEKVYLPVKLYMGGSGSQPTLRYFVDKFPLFLSAIRCRRCSVTSSPISTTQTNLISDRRQTGSCESLTRSLLPGGPRSQVASEFESLLEGEKVAKLLGDSYVKTLQRWLPAQA